MKIKSLLAKAAKCKNDSDAEKLLETLKRIFGNHKLLSNLSINNECFMMEDDCPNAEFELNKEISDEYITMIRPEIRHGAFAVVICTYRMLDKLGMCSKNFEKIAEMDHLIEPNENETINDVCKQSYDLAIANHQSLIESVGVPHLVAKKTAKASW